DVDGENIRCGGVELDRATFGEAGHLSSLAQTQRPLRCLETVEGLTLSQRARSALDTLEAMWRSTFSAAPSGLSSAAMSSAILHVYMRPPGVGEVFARLTRHRLPGCRTATP